jgi:hypothetical protein
MSNTTTQHQEIIGYLRRTADALHSEVYPEFVTYWPKGMTETEATKARKFNIVQFTTNGRIKNGDGGTLGLLTYQDAGKLSTVTVDILDMAKEIRAKANEAKLDALAADGKSIELAAAEQAEPVQFMCNTCEALVDFPGRHCTGTAIADHAVARLTAQLRRDKTVTASSPEPAYQPAADDVLHPSKEDFRSAAIYARALGSREGRYVTLAAGVTYTPEQEVQITACVIRVLGTWRIVGCCDIQTTECYECNKLFEGLSDGRVHGQMVPPPAAETVDHTSGYPSASAAPEARVSRSAVAKARKVVSLQSHLPVSDLVKLDAALDVLAKQPLLGKILVDILATGHLQNCTGIHRPGEECSR